MATNKDETATTTTTTTKTMTQTEIEAKLKTSFIGLNDSNVTILAHYMYKYPKKWRSDDENFVADVNKIIPEAFAYNMRPSNALFGAIIAIIVILMIALIGWVVTIVMKKNKSNVLNDPNVANPIFI